MSLASIALRKNMLTIKQVANVLDIAEACPEKSFVKIAMELDLIDRTDADQLLHHQQVHCPTIRKLVVECGLLTQRQTSVLFLHFERNGFGVKTQMPQNAAQKPVQNPEPASEQDLPSGPRGPKFRSRPIMARQQSRGIS